MENTATPTVRFTPAHELVVGMKIAGGVITSLHSSKSGKTVYITMRSNSTGAVFEILQPGYSNVAVFL